MTFREIRCPRLGGDANFKYCRTCDEPFCSRIITCWAQKLDIGSFLAENYPPEQIQQGLERKVKDKLGQLLQDRRKIQGLKTRNSFRPSIASFRLSASRYSILAATGGPRARRVILTLNCESFEASHCAVTSPSWLELSARMISLTCSPASLSKSGSIRNRSGPIPCRGESKTAQHEISAFEAPRFFNRLQVFAVADHHQD